MMRTLLRLLQSFFRRDRFERDLDDEVRAHLDLLAADYERKGLTPVQARAAARRDFGGVEQVKERYRDRSGLALVGGCARDLRFAARLLLKERWFTAAAVLALALGIAANNTVFVLANGLLLRDLPFAEPDRIVTIGTDVDGLRTGISYPDWVDMAAAQVTLDGVAAVLEATMNVVDDASNEERFTGAYVSARAFGLIGHAPVLGRDFGPDDDRPSAPAVVILSDALWRTRYRADPSVIGRGVRVNGVLATVIGVMGDGFAFPARSRLWQPMSQLSSQIRQERDARVLQGVGRLANSATTTQAAEDLGRIADALAIAHPATNRNVTPRVALFRWATLGGRARTAFPILMTMVGFVLLIACANVANLLLARAAYRAHEISVRLAVGASRAQIVRQLLVESVLLVSIAGLIGLGLSALAVEVFEDVYQAAGGLPYWVTFPMDWRVFSYLALLCLGTGIGFGLVPALQASRPGIAGRLVEAGTGHTGALRQRRWSARFVVAQLALTPMLLTGAGLMVRSMIAQAEINPGVNTSGLVRMRLGLSGPAYESSPQRARFYQQLEDRLADAEVSATLASHAPFEGASYRQLAIDGQSLSGETRGRTLVRVMTVGRGYFDVLATPAVRGGRFTPADDARTVTPALVNERFAAVYFANRDPIGHRLGLTTPVRGASAEDVEIIGVAPNIRQSSTEAQEAVDPIVYVPYTSNPLPAVNILVRSSAPLGVVMMAVRNHVRAIDPYLPLYDVMRLDDSLALSDERLGLRVFGSLLVVVGGIALLLSTIGLYSVTAYATGQRTREIGIRVALGSRPSQIGWLVVQRAAQQLAVGLSIGLAGALATNQVLRGVLIGVGSTDFVTLLGVVVLLTVVTSIASYIPARRAMRLSPVTALRIE
jgi:putative ABC transport system permease protein